jgi:hypothetical protein
VQLSANQITVAGRVVQISSTTVIRKRDGGGGVLADLVPGRGVEVRGVVSGSVVLASHIEIEDRSPVPPAPGPTTPPPPNVPNPGAEVEFTGTLTALTGSSPGATLTIGGRTVLTNAATVVRRRGDVVPFSRLAVGQVVEVRGVSQGGGAVLANRLTIEDEADDEDEVEFTGTLTAMTGSSPGATLTIAGRPVLTNATTIVRRRGDVVGFDRIRIGQRIEVKGLPQPGGAVLAVRLTLEDD